VCGDYTKGEKMTQPISNAQQAYYQQGYPQQASPNAVSINIYNPQAYGTAPNGAGAVQQAPQQVPYNYTNSVYQMPQANAYQQPQQAPEAYQQYMPVQSPIAPAPQIMPDSVMSQPQQQPVQEAQVQNPEAAKNETVNNEANQEQTQNANTVDVNALVSGLADADTDKKAQTINQIAEYAQGEPSVALQVVSEPIMNGLINVINEDTTGLEGPTDEQIAIAEKITKGEQLTPEEDALSEQLSPRDKANKNRIFALYTLAMIQKLQREELNQYIENQKANGEQPVEPLKIEELPGYNDIVNVIKNDARPEVKVAAMQALQYIAEPDDKASVEAALTEALNSEDEVVKAAAQEVLDRFGTTEQPAENNQTEAKTEEQPKEAKEENKEENKEEQKAA
jgi:hypothetical protein